MKKLNNKKGISLIVLVITIIVIIVLAGAVILNLTKNNPIEVANKSAFDSSVDGFKIELLNYESADYTSTLGEFESNKFQANETSITYTGSGNLDIANKTIYDVITTLKNSKYKGQFEVKDGELVYVGTDEKLKLWAAEINLKVVSKKTIEDYEDGIANTLYKYTGDWIITSNNPYEGQYCFTNKDINDSQSSEATFVANVPNDGREYLLGFYYYISSESDYDFFEVYINDILTLSKSGTSSYYAYSESKLNAGDNTIKFVYSKDSSASYGLDSVFIDNLHIAKIKMADPIITTDFLNPTNQGVTVTISYPTIATKKQYSLDGINWIDYTSEIIVTTNGITIYAKATDINNETSETSFKIYNATYGVNAPILTAGMNAIKWNTTTSIWDIVTDPANDTSWYDYENKQWANAQTADGSMWVWIPRYEYRIPTPHSSTAQTIAVNFITNLQVNPTTGYIVHPAFTFGSTELTGIWVAKFEASGTTATVASKPNVKPLAQIYIDVMFTACRNMETTYGTQYGWGTSGTGIDTHLMKNVEWGAVAYLSSSAYGKTGEVWINPYFNTSTGYSLTGQAGTSVSASYSTSTYAYDNATYGVNASTTGNIYGVYDMSGGSHEYTAAYVNNGNSNLTTYGSSLVNAASQYKDVYTSSVDTRAGNYSAASSKKGDAVYETSASSDSPYNNSWYSDISYMPYSNIPFFTRGAHASETRFAGFFAFGSDYGAGTANSYCGFRPCVVVSASL